MANILKINKLFVFVSLLVLTLFSTRQAVAAEQLLFSIHGSNTVGAKLGPALAEAYLKHLGAEVVGVFPGDEENEARVSGFIPSLNDVATIYVAAHGSSSGFKAMLKGKAQIAAASRPIKLKEQKMLGKMGNFNSRASEYVVGIDGLAIVVNPGNPISKLDISQIAQLFSGQIKNWSELGGADLPVKLFARDDKSGTWDTFKSLVLAKKYKLSDKALRFESNKVLSDRVAQTPGGIGFVSLNTIGGSKPLQISDGTDRALRPELLHVSTEDYVLSRRLFMYLPEKKPDPEALKFLEFVASDEAQPIVSSVGYVHQSVELMQPDVQSAPYEYQQVVHEYDRASVNFRFDKGKAHLDNKALNDIERLARFIKNQPGEILLIGFAEQDDNARHSDLLARLRADVVRRSLIKAGVDRKNIMHQGYGQYLALSSADSLASKIRNRRVEVWFKPAGLKSTSLVSATFD